MKTNKSKIKQILNYYFDIDYTLKKIRFCSLGVIDFMNIETIFTDNEIKYWY